MHYEHEYKIYCFFTIVSDLKKLTVAAAFESEGDCGYSANVLLTRDQILDDQLSIKCRAGFSTRKLGVFKTLSFNEQNELLNNGPRRVSEVGLIHPEVCDCEPIEMLSGSTGMLNFIQVKYAKIYLCRHILNSTVIYGIINCMSYVVVESRN